LQALSEAVGVGFFLMEKRAFSTSRTPLLGKALETASTLEPITSG
jgi:hypothetical protein